MSADFIKSNWNDAAFRLAEAYQWIKQLDATEKTQPPQGTLASIAATLMCFPNKLNDPEFITVLRKWYFCTTLASNPSPANNYKIGDDFRRFCEFTEKGNLIPYPKVYFDVEGLIDIK